MIRSLSLALVLTACAGPFAPTDRSAPGIAALLVRARRITSRTALDTALAITAGDIAGCNSNFADESTATVVKRFGSTSPVIPLGDNVYTSDPGGSYACYAATGSWGQFEARTLPVIGNHECLAPGAAGYVNYFNNGADSGAAGHRDRFYYAVNYGPALLLVLNSELGDGIGCDTQTLAGAREQARWIAATIRANPTKCQFAFMHRPWKSNDVNPRRSVGNMQPIIDTLVAYGVEVLFSGHNHNHQIWKPLLADGVTVSGAGLRQIVVGTGGASFTDLNAAIPAALDKQIGNVHGAMRLEFRPPDPAKPNGSWTASFWTPASGIKLSYTSGSCH